MEETLGWCAEGQPYEETVRGQPSVSHRGASGETKSTDTLVLGLEPPEVGGNKFLLFEPPNPWCCVIAVLANKLIHRRS